MWSYSRFYTLTSFSTKPFVILLKLSTRWINWGLHNAVDDGNVLLKLVDVLTVLGLTEESTLYWYKPSVDHFETDSDTKKNSLKVSFKRGPNDNLFASGQLSSVE